MQKVSIIFSEKFIDYQGEFCKEKSLEGLLAIIAKIVVSPFSDCVEWIEPSQRNGCLDLPSIAQLAANSWLDAVDIAMNQNSPVFVLTSVHGKPSKNQYFSPNAMSAANYALEQPGIKRIAILNFNSQRIEQNETQDNPSIAFCSIHPEKLDSPMKLTLEQNQSDNILNIPLKSGSDFSAYKIAFETKILSFLVSFTPDLLIVSLGLAHEDELILGDSQSLDKVGQFSKQQINHETNRPTLRQAQGNAQQNCPTLSDFFPRVRLKSKDFYDLAESTLSITPKVIFGLEGGDNCSRVGQSVLEAIKACCCHSAKSTIIQQFIAKQNFYL